MTHVEILVTSLVAVVAIVLLIGLLLPPQVRSGGTRSLRDQVQIKEIHKAMSIFSNDHKGRLPIPGLVKRGMDPDTGAFLPGVGPEDFTQNDTARLYSLMVSHEFFNTDLLISSVEVSRHVIEDDDYNYDAYQPANGRYWDDTFVMRIDDPSIGANASYAHMALCGNRLDQDTWSIDPEGMPTVSTRGTRDGAATGPNYDRSPTLRMMGPKDRWVGNVVFADNHTESLETFFPTLTRYAAGGKDPQPDNIFRAEFEHPHGNQAAGDAYLGIFISSTQYTVEPVFDPLDPE